MTNSFYTPAAFASTELPPMYSQFQPAAWQHQPSSEVDMTTSQSWSTDRAVHNHGPVLFDWYSSPVEPWDLQCQNLDTTSQNRGALAFQSSQFSSGFQEAPLKAEKSFEPIQAWQQPSYRAQEGCPAVQEVPQLWNGSGMFDSRPPLSVELESPGRASKRRRRSSTATLEIQFAPQIVGSAQPSPVECVAKDQVLEPHRRFPTATAFYVPDHAPPPVADSPQNEWVQIHNSNEGSSPRTESPKCMMPAAEASPVPPTPISQPSPMLTPSVRVISDRRESVSKMRRGSNTVFKTQSANTKRGHYASEVWESHKPAIRKMYIDEGKPLREVIKTMEQDHSFPAT